MRVQFDAQAWVNDHAVLIDPEGPTVWEVSPAGKAEILGYRDRDDALAYERWFDFDPNCPDWIKRHSGPFRIYVVEGTLDGDQGVVLP